MLKLTIHNAVILNTFVTVGLKQKKNGMELKCKQPVSCNCWWQIEAGGLASGNIMHKLNVSQYSKKHSLS